MKRILFSAVMFSSVVASSLIGVSSANAQTTESYSAYNRNYYVAPSPVWNYPRFGYDSWGSHASTYEAGVLAGMGSLYRGVGEYNVANSVAAYNWQLARNANLMNNIAERQARANMYASVRIAQERRHQENMKKNQAVAAFHAKEQGAVLASTQIDRTTGDIKWPVVLQAAAFADDRESIEMALDKITDQHQVALANPEQEFKDSVNALKSKLAERKDEFRPSDYYAAKSFLDRLQNVTREVSEQEAKSF